MANLIICQMYCHVFAPISYFYIFFFYYYSREEVIATPIIK